jgi:hypothetical protein
MNINQRDVYLLPHPINPNSEDRHPGIVLSVLDANNHERTFIAVMITSSKIKKDDYSFELRNEMFESDLPKGGSHARMHLISLVLNEEVLGKRLNVMKVFYFNQLMASIGDLIFSYNFTPITQSIA